MNELQPCISQHWLLTGAETSTYCVHGLWERPLGDFTAFLRKEGFNALRLPLSAELMLNLDGTQPNGINFQANPELQGLSAGEVLDAVVLAARHAGLLVMFDLHHLAMADGIGELWYDDKFSEARVIQAWTTVVQRYAMRHWNVFAIDLKNEPHGRASWGSGCLATDWRLAAERIGSLLQKLAPRLLIFVEGVSENCSPIPNKHWAFWGGALDSAAAAPVRLTLPSKLVYSPHVYGPGEWGGRARAGSQDRAWQERLAAFLRERGLTDTFYWCLNPNSGDTGGVLEDDWRTPVRDKLQRLARVCPHPSRLEVDGAGCLLRVVCDSAHAEASPAADSGEQPGQSWVVVDKPRPPWQPPAGGHTPAQAQTLCVDAHCVHEWRDGQGRAHFQLDVRLVNSGPRAVPGVSMACPGAEVQALWNVAEAAAAAGMRCFGIPAWLRDRGGLQPGEALQFGGIFLTRAPRITARPADSDVQSV